MTVIQYSQMFWGNSSGKSSRYCLYGFDFGCALTTRSLSDAIAANFMPQTPVMVFIVVSLTLAANAARNGIEVIGRWSELIAMAVLASTLVLVLPYSAMRFGNLYPYCPMVWPSPQESTHRHSPIPELSVVGMIIPCLHNRKERCVIRGMPSFSADYHGRHAVSLAAVFGSQATTSGVPGFILARQISIGQFLERIETIPVTIWVLKLWLRLRFSSGLQS
jgi:spore germination protein KB